MTEGLVITGGVVVGPRSTVEADVLVRRGKVAAVARRGELAAPDHIDASGCYLLPGGVDGHVHLENPALGVTRSADDFFSGTVAAACGGTTTVIDFVKKIGDASLYDCYQEKRGKAVDNAVIDFGFHTVVPPEAASDGAFDDLDRLVDEGSTSWKFFMAYPGSLMVDWETLTTGFQKATEKGVLPIVHAEEGDIVESETRRLVRIGSTEARDHLAAHPEAAELHAVQRVIELSAQSDVPVLILHVSSALAAAEIREARRRGVAVHAESCPQYLLAAYEDYCSLGDDAAKYVCSPPIRPRANQNALWSELAAGTFSTIGTDHSPFTIGQPADLPPQKPHGRGYFPRIPNGVPGVEERLMVIWAAVVATGRLTPNQFVDMTSTTPAKLLGLYPQKGAIISGADADIVIWDPRASGTLRSAALHGRADYSIYDGMELTGKPRQVLSRGRSVFEAETGFVGQRGHGQYLPRAVRERKPATRGATWSSR